MALNTDFQSRLLERFIRYARINTQSLPERDTYPSTPGQWNLLRLLQTELREIGVSELELTEHGYLLGTIPSTLKDSSHQPPVIAYFAHVDTADDFSSEDVKPLVHKNYDGKPIVLPDDPTRVLDPGTNESLKSRVGKTIITASGKSLLGADDKCGVAIIVTLAEFLLKHTEIPHGTIRICLNPDEEIGMGTAHLDLKKLGADFGYTIDANDVGRVEWETFSADKMIVRFEGVPMHPGYAYQQMVNPVVLAEKFLSELRSQQKGPEEVKGREGFAIPTAIFGDLNGVTVEVALRDFELEVLERRRASVQNAIDRVLAAEPRGRASVKLVEQYRNIRYAIEKEPRTIELVEEAIEKVGLKPVRGSFRGGTDGCALTMRGILTPNIFSGAHNIHGPLEWTCLEDMALAVEVLVELSSRWGEEN